jgi:hypothetical protein
LSNWFNSYYAVNSGCTDVTGGWSVTPPSNVTTALFTVSGNLNTLAINTKLLVPPAPPAAYMTSFVSGMPAQIAEFNSAATTVINTKGDFTPNITAIQSGITNFNVQNIPNLISNLQALINAINAAVTKSGVINYNNWWPLAGQPTTVAAPVATALNNLVITANNMITLLNAYNTQTIASTLKPFVAVPIIPTTPVVTPTNNTPKTNPAGSIPTAAQTAALVNALQTNLQTLNTNMTPINNVGSDFSGFQTSIQSDISSLISNPTASAILAAAKTSIQNNNLSQAILINDLIWNLKSLAGPQGLGQLTSWWRNSSGAVTTNMQAGIATCNNMLTALDTYIAAAGITYS